MSVPSNMDTNGRNPIPTCTEISQDFTPLYLKNAWSLIFSPYLIVFRANGVSGFFALCFIFAQAWVPSQKSPTLNTPNAVIWLGDL